jgi:hypothetical protein
MEYSVHLSINRSVELVLKVVCPPIGFASTETDCSRIPSEIVRSKVAIDDKHFSSDSPKTRPMDRSSALVDLISALIKAPTSQLCLLHSTYVVVKYFQRDGSLGRVVTLTGSLRRMLFPSNSVEI